MCENKNVAKETVEYIYVVTIYFDLYTSHVKLMLVNSWWQTQIGVCERHNNMLANCWEEVGENRDKF